MVFEIKRRRGSVSIFVECRHSVVKAAIAGKQKFETLEVTRRLQAADVRRIQAPEKERHVAKELGRVFSLSSLKIHNASWNSFHEPDDIPLGWRNSPFLGKDHGLVPGELGQSPRQEVGDTGREGRPSQCRANPLLTSLFVNSTRLEQCQIRGILETPIALTASGFLHDF